MRFRQNALLLGVLRILERAPSVLSLADRYAHCRFKRHRMASNRTYALRGPSASRSLAGGLVLLGSLIGCAHLGRSPPASSTTSAAGAVASPPSMSSGSSPADTGLPPANSTSATGAKRDLPAAGPASSKPEPNNSSAAKARSGKASTAAAPKIPVAAQKGAASDKEQPGPAATGTPTLSLNDIEQRLRDTHAIGVFTKLSLKNQIDDLLGQVRAYHLKQAGTSLPQLRQRYDVLLQKVTDLLQSGDAPLARDIFSSREAIWSILTDPAKIGQL